MSSAGAVAVVFAGGVGSRMKRAEQPKQFVPVGGRPILVRTLEHFQSHPEIHAVYLSCIASHIDDAWALVHSFGLDKVRRIVSGGASAQESIFHGLCSAADDHVEEDAAVLVHDGVRPLINHALISRNIASTHAHGNAVTAISCFETVARSEDGAQSITSIPRRDEMHVLQAPQTFRLGTACRLNTRSAQEGLMGTFVDQAQLHRHYGERLHLVRGFRGNVKITTDLDLLQYRLLVSSGHLGDVISEDA